MPAAEYEAQEEEEEPAASWQEQAAALVALLPISAAPSWLVSLLVHLAITVVLALIALPQAVKSRFLVEVTYSEELGEQLLDDSPYMESLESVAIVPAGRSTVVVGTDLSDQLGPAESGGLLAALHIWRRMLIEGPSKIGDAYYLGTQPLRGDEGLFDVVVVTYDVVEVQMSFDPDSGRLMALEMFPELDIIEDVLFVHDGKYITSAGGAKSFEAALYLCQHLYGEEVTRSLARGLVIEWDLDSVPYLYSGD